MKLYIWKEEFKSRKFVIELLITFMFLIIILIYLAYFLMINENRQGVLLNDPLINIFNPLDMTWLIFLILYTGIISSIFYLFNRPRILLLAMQSYSLMIIFRMAAMYLIPLEPPLGMHPLADPVVELFATGQALTKDLFFSGHTATLFLLFLIIDNKILKHSLLIGTIIIGISLILQHVHYTIDILCAPFFAYTSFAIIQKIKRKA